MTLTHEDVRKILAILDESDYEEVHIEFGDLKLDLHRHGNPSSEIQPPRGHEKPKDSGVSPQAPEMAGKESPVSIPRKPAYEAAIPEGMVAATAPMVGTFYRAPAPGAKPFVEVGDRVQADDTVCLLEVMKLFNSLKAGATGTVEKILVENAALVAAGQPLILIRKDAD